MTERDSYTNLMTVLRNRPDAEAEIRGISEYPGIIGRARFFRVRKGTLVYMEIKGLPYFESPCACRVFGVHIHSGGSCSGNESDPLANVMTHYNPKNCPHPCHAGDMPPLFGNRGYAFSLFLTDRFNVEEIIGKTVIVHSSPDDFKTQPSGNSGEKIACGVIRKY